MVKEAETLVVCLDNTGYEASLERRKIYVALPDPSASKLGQVRVIDESGEDYLYSQRRFVAVELPSAIKLAVMKAA